jgi:hypothetical protein
MVALAWKQGKKGQMDADFSESYDQEDDIYYVTFETGEPSYAVEVDDILVLEVGMFTNMPTGFRILNFSKNRVDEISFQTKIEKAISPLRKKAKSRFLQRTKDVERSLGKVLAAAAV